MNIQDLDIPSFKDVVGIQKQFRAPKWKRPSMLDAKYLLKTKVKIKETPKEEKAISNKAKFDDANYDRMQMHRDQGYSVNRTAELNNCSRNTVLRHTKAPDKKSVASIWQIYRMIRDGTAEEMDIEYDGKIAGKFTPVEDFKDDNNK